VKRNTYASRIDMNPGMSEQQATMVAQGAKLALEKGCARCHSIDESNALLPATLGPTWVGLYRSERKFTDGTTAIADEAYLTRSMMDPMVQIVAGYPPLMPSFQGVLQSGEAAAITEYIKTLKKDSPTKLGAR
jgi:cytochrome c oxidase subunit 2